MKTSLELSESLSQSKILTLLLSMNLSPHSLLKFSFLDAMNKPNILQIPPKSFKISIRYKIPSTSPPWITLNHSLSPPYPLSPQHSSRTHWAQRTSMENPLNIRPYNLLTQLVKDSSRCALIKVCSKRTHIYTGLRLGARCSHTESASANHVRISDTNYCDLIKDTCTVFPRQKHYFSSHSYNVSY